MGRQAKQVNELADAVEIMHGDVALCEGSLALDCAGCVLRLRSNSEKLLEHLGNYFAHLVCDAENSDLEIIAIESPMVDLNNEFLDWKREPVKRGRKDAYLDLPAGRLVKKVRTGMLFLQSEPYRIAAGPCLENDNQVINFINAQYMNWLQQRGWLICHASGLVRQGKTLAMAGLSGGGKSTLMLQLLEQEDVDYLTNDRLFIHQQAEGVEARGIPKLPRINPGTIVHNSRLQALLPEKRRAELLALPPQELWELEEKYDVDVEALYGAGRIVPQAPLSAFLVLNWQRESAQPLQLRRVELEQRRDLLSAIMKSPGPFYQYADGRFFQDTTELDERTYLQLLASIPIYEASGRIDFTGLQQYCYTEILS